MIKLIDEKSKGEGKPGVYAAQKLIAKGQSLVIQWSVIQLFLLLLQAMAYSLAALAK